MNSGSEDGDALTEARQTIVRQQEEIEDLRRRLADDRFGRELRRLFGLAEIGTVITPPITYAQLLKLIVETAARVIDAKAGSFLLLDEENQELVVEHPLGPRAQEVDKLRVPLGHGIAGLVAVSGQPMAISNASHDPRQAADIAERIGYWPEGIICVPLIYSDRIIGVLELLDKAGGEPFSSTDLQTLGLFANLAAVAVELSRSYGSLTVLVSSMMASLGATADERVQLQERVQAFATRSETSAAHRRTLDIAELMHEIAEHGDQELDVCQGILESFAGYLRSRRAATLESLTSR